MNSGKSVDPDSLMVLLFRSFQAFRADVDHYLDTAHGVPAVLRELNGGQRRLLTLIPTDGARGTELADKAGISKQALGQFASGLEAAGLIRAESDPADRRARIWRLTPAGTRTARAARATLEAVEAQWRKRLGARHYENLAAILRLSLSDSRP